MCTSARCVYQGEIMRGLNLSARRCSGMRKVLKFVYFLEMQGEVIYFKKNNFKGWYFLLIF
jgi:hypothetical protein